MITARDCRGASLTEQLVAMLLSSVILSSLYGFYRAELTSLAGRNAQIEIFEDARGALELLVRDLRNAGSWDSGSPPPETTAASDPEGDPDEVCNRIYAASGRVLHVQMDLNGNNSCADTDPRENIRYEIAGPTATCPGANSIRRNGDCFVANVTTPVSGKLFTYYDADGADLGDAPPPWAIRRVRIAFAVHASAPDPRTGAAVTARVSSSVELRN